MANNIVLLPAGADAADQIVLTAVATSITWAGGQQGSAVYTGTITNGAGNGLRGKAFTVSGFVGPNNNGTFLCVASTSTTLTLSNSLATAETATAGFPAVGTATASYGTQSFPIQYATKIENMMDTNQGDNVNVSLNGGETLVAVAIGLKSLWPFDQLHGTAPYGPYSTSPAEFTTPFGFTQGLNDFNADPTISDNASVTPISGVELELGVAAQFAVLGGSTVTSAGIWTIGNGGLVGLTPGTSITGAFVPATFHINDAIAIQGMANANTAYAYYKGLSAGTTVTQLSGMTLTPGTYTASSSLDLAASGNVNFDAGGNPNAVFIIQVGTTFTSNVSSTMTLLNGAQAGNIIFVCGTGITLNGSVIYGTYISGTGAVTLSQTAPLTFTGRAISLVGAVTNAGTTTTALPPQTGGSVNDWVLVAHINLVDSDYTVTSVPPVANSTPYPDYVKVGNFYFQIPPTYVYNAANQWQSSKWNLDGYYPSLYVWVVTNANAGTYNINLNSVYQGGSSTFPGVIPPQDLAAGKPIFDGGVNFQVFKFSGAAAGGSPAGVVDSVAIGESHANPATPGPLTTTAANGDALISIGLMKSGNVFQPGTVGGTPISLTLTQVAPIILGAGQYPVRDGGAVYTGTITGGADNAFVGYTFTVTGFVNEGGANNGTFVCTASTASTLILSNGSSVAETHAGTATTTPSMTRISSGALVGSEAHYMVEYGLTAPGSAGTFNPSFLNPLGYEMVIASIAIQSS